MKTDGSRWIRAETEQKRDAYAKHNVRQCGKPRQEVVGIAGREAWRKERINWVKKYFCKEGCRKRTKLRAIATIW